MNVYRKAVPVEVKAVDGQEGVVEAIVSVFGNVDLGGDRVVKGAFAKSLDKWRQSASPIPVVWSHDWSDLWSHIGYVDPKDVDETEVGLRARYTLDIHDNPAAAQAYKLLRRGTVKEHSFAYTVQREKTAKDGANDLLEVDLIEIGPTLKGMNPDTEVLAVKSALEQVTAEHDKPAAEVKAPTPLEVAQKAGRTLSKANEAKLRAAMESIAQVLSSLGGEEPEKSSQDEVTGKSTDPAVKSEPEPEEGDLEIASLDQEIEKVREWLRGSQ